MACLSVDDIVVPAESARKLQREMDEFYSVFMKRMLKVNVSKLKCMTLIYCTGCVCQ